MKKNTILIIALLSIFIVGCSSQQAESNLVEEGRHALESYKYEDAMKILSNALEADSTDTHARSMYMQAMKMSNVEEYKSETNYKKAIDELEEIELIKNGSNKIKDKASEELKKLKKLYEEQQQAQEQRKEDAKISAQQGSNSANQAIINAEEESKKEEDEEQVEEEQGENQEEQNTEEQGSENQNNENTNSSMDNTSNPQNNTTTQQSTTNTNQ